MASFLSMRMDTSDILRCLDDLVEGSLTVARPAAQAGAQVLYEEVKQRCPVSEAPHTFYGKYSKKNGVTYHFAPGTLKNAIYQVFSKDNSGKGFATYHIAWNHRAAPYGFMVEFGTSRAPAHPFLRPAYDAMVKEALEAAKRRWEDGAREVLGRLGVAA